MTEVLAGPGPTEAPKASALDLFLRHAKAYPEDPAVEDGADRLSYADLLGEAEARAERLASAGAGRGSRIAVETRYGTDYAVALIATWLLEATAVPLDPSSPADRRRYQVRQARCDAAVTLAGADGVVQEAVAEQVAAGARDAGGTPDPADGQVPAYILFTSGSTGVPKGVVAEHPALANMLGYFADSLRLGRGHRMLAHSSTAFDMSVPETLVPLISGGTVVVAPARSARNPEVFAEWLRAGPTDAAFATPSQLRLLLAFLGGQRVFGTLVSAGEALPAALAEELLRVAGVLWNGYGPTEATVCALGTRVLPPFADPMPIGLPVAGLTAHVLDAGLRPVREGDIGELCLSGIGLARGYAGDPGQTRRAFTTGPGGARIYRTGDLVSVGPDGRFRFHGRGDDQVKIRGHRVELGEIEAVAERAPGVARATALVSDVLHGRSGLYLAVAGEPGAGDDPDPPLAGLRRHLRNALPEHMQPQRIVTFPDLPRNASGKTDRKAVRRLVEDRLREP